MTTESRCEEFQLAMDQYVRGLLEVSARHALAAHTAQCATCTKMLELTEALRDLGREAARPPPDLERVLAQRRKENRRMWARMIAVWVLLGGGSLVIFPLRQALVTSATGTAIVGYAIVMGYRQKHDFQRLASGLASDSGALVGLLRADIERRIRAVSWLRSGGGALVCAVVGAWTWATSVGSAVMLFLGALLILGVHVYDWWRLLPQLRAELAELTES